MVSVKLQGRITEDGKLEVDLPEGLPPGEVTINIEASTPDGWDGEPWTDEELQEMLAFKGHTGAEIAASEAVGSWKDLGITDGQAWVDEMRRERRERRQW